MVVPLKMYAGIDVFVLLFPLFSTIEVTPHPGLLPLPLPLLVLEVPNTNEDKLLFDIILGFVYGDCEWISE